MCGVTKETSHIRRENVEEDEHVVFSGIAFEAHDIVIDVTAALLAQMRSQSIGDQLHLALAERQAPSLAGNFCDSFECSFSQCRHSCASARSDFTLRVVRCP